MSGRVSALAPRGLADMARRLRSVPGPRRGVYREIVAYVTRGSYRHTARLACGHTVELERVGAVALCAGCAA